MWQAVSIAQQIYANGSWPESDWVEVSADEFPKSSVRWSDSCHKKLEKIGFNHLGDFEDVELTPIIGQRIFVRLMLSPDGKTWAAIYKPSMPWPGILGWVKLMISGKWFVPGVIEFESANESRQFIITNNTGDLDLFDISPGIDKHALKKGSSVEKVLASHKDRLLEFGSRSQTLVEVTGLGGVVEMQDHQRVMKNEYRHSIGFVTDEELIQLLGDRYDDIGGLVRIKLSELADLSVS
jgi:hypothetical protein